MIITAVIILGVFAFISLSSNFWIQWWWFESLGFSSALTVRYISGAIAFVVAAVLVGGFVTINWRIALQRQVDASKGSRVAGSRFVRWPLWVVTVVLACFAGYLAALNWATWRLALAGQSFGISDPIFGRDAGFYVFRLPAIEYLHRGALVTAIITLVIVALIYLGMRGLDRVDNVAGSPRARRHMLALAALVLLLFGAGYLIANFNLLYSTRGFGFGPGYTDVNVTRPLNFILALVSALAAAVLLVGRRNDQLRWLAAIFIAWALAVGIGAFLPQVVQQTIVVPNELQREEPFIANNIALTRAGFGLDTVEARTLSGQGEPPASALQPDSPVLQNVRLWDYRIARETFQQLRSFVPYYVFSDVDVDRYPEFDSVQQVLISARELDTDGLPANAQTWTNQHLSYTHGYAAVVSPISEATSQGLPVFTVGSIPPDPAGPLTIERPEIYFGEQDAPWVAVNTGVQEVNGIPGETPPTMYDGLGQGSISLDNYLRRVILTIYLGDRRVLFTDELTSESRVLLIRSITDRVSTIAPFLRLDADPYLTIVDGRLIWIIDAYTATNRFPYSTPYSGVNYARQSFKVTVDAYDGTVVIYRTEVPDPIADAYDSLFPELIRPIREAPPALAEHFRYPEELFDLQTEVFAAYHVTDPTAFYNGEDRWQIASAEVAATAGQPERQVPIEAYYMTLPLPGETETGFKIIRPFTPINRPNMTAWMAGQSSPTGISRLVVYRFPRQSTVFGPQQVEARINQDPDISAQFTLLSQSGSRVIPGNLLVIPVEETVMYVQPVYLRATETGGAPTQLSFVIVATEQRVEMRPTLAEALAAVSGADAAAPPPGTNVEGGQPASGLPAPASVDDALAAFERGQQALREGDWAAYGEAQEELERILETLTGSPATDATPMPVAAPVLETAPVATPAP